MSNYNEIYVHRTIGMTPLQADEKPTNVVLKQREIPDKRIAFNKGDSVRISTQKGVSQRGTYPTGQRKYSPLSK